VTSVSTRWTAKKIFFFGIWDASCSALGKRCAAVMIATIVACSPRLLDRCALAWDRSEEGHECATSYGAMKRPLADAHAKQLLHVGASRSRDF
jgi:hypothetical protein